MTGGLVYNNKITMIQTAMRMMTMIIKMNTQHFLHAYETFSCLPTHVTATLSKYTLIPKLYQALLMSAVSGNGHRIHTTKRMSMQAKPIVHATQFSSL